MVAPELLMAGFDGVDGVFVVDVAFAPVDLFIFVDAGVCLGGYLFLDAVDLDQVSSELRILLQEPPVDLVDAGQQGQAEILNGVVDFRNI